jgi:hypothetical protein
MPTIIPNNQQEPQDASVHLSKIEEGLGLGAGDLSDLIIRTEGTGTSNDATMRWAVSSDSANAGDTYGETAEYIITTTGTLLLTGAQPGDGRICVLKLVQDATGGHVVTLGANFKFAGGVAPTLTTTANAVDILTFAAMPDGIFYLVGSCLDAS